MGNDYKATLNLPKTDFAMRASLSTREPEQIARWDADGVYQEMVARRAEAGAERFILHDGPPYANGNIHHGHILNKTLKDFVVKYKSMAGYLAEYVPGWDCHGLPIEHQVDQELGEAKREMSKVEVRRACAEYARKWVGVQSDEFRRMMIFGEWGDPYLTMSHGYEATTVRELGRFFEQGLVYRGLKPVHWDWASKTALAEAEVEYQSFRTEHVYVKFGFDQAPEWLMEAAGGRAVSVVIWTTTPWTLPANLAIALNPELDYELVGVDGDAYVVASGLRDRVLEDCGIDDFEVLAEFEGRRLVGELGEGRGLEARHPWLDRGSVLLPADYVTLEQGTGCVHTAPGHGQEDFALGQQFGLGVICPVDEHGRFIEEQVPEWGGEHVFRANGLIQAYLDEIGALVNAVGDKLVIERYPFGWRSKKPIIFRATTQWFIAMEPESAGLEEGMRLREEALAEIEEVRWVPEWGRDRIRGMVEGRPDWCISRQRTWGVPITVVYCTGCDEAIATRELADYVAELVEEHGADVWFERAAEELVPEGTACAMCGSTSFKKEEDILDVWFDSGTSWAAVLEEKLGWGDTADLYLEGSDQHRGWFQSSLLCGVGTRGYSPYRTCLTHGFVNDQDGHKYSKSSKNFEPPEQMLEEYGAEILRLWVAAVDYRGDITLSDEILKRVADAYRKVRNTFRFMLGNLGDFDPAGGVDHAELPEIDRWILHRTAEVVERIEQAYEEYQFHTIYHTLVQFMTVDLSNIYMDITKDRMYCEGRDSQARRAGQTAYWQVLNALVRAVAPVLSFTSEEVWQHLGKGEGAPVSVFLADFPEVPARWRDEELGARWEQLLEVRQAVQRALEEKRAPRKSKKPGQIGSSQEAHVTLRASGKTYALLEEVADDLAELFIVSRAELVEGEVVSGELVDVEVAVAQGDKCPRCWNFWVDPESGAEICSRCEGVVAQLG